MLLSFLLAHFVTVVVTQPQPNILIFLVDDLGWNDVGWHNQHILTPNFDHYAKNGIILNHSYVQPMCSPSRSALLTGLYPFRTGMSHSVLYSFAAIGLPTEYTLLPERLRNLGYSTHIIGKWHLGYCNNAYLPQSRGFDTSYFIAPGILDYFTHEVPSKKNSSCLFNNLNVVTEHRGTYINELFVNEFNSVLTTRNKSQPFFMYIAPNAPHSPLEVPENYINIYSGLTNEPRRNYSALVTALDDSFGRIVQLLKDNSVYENTVILFSSDNGGQVKSGGCNFPLRGAKVTLYEGGTRAPAFIHSPLLPRVGYTYDGLIHITDWFTTIIHIAGGTIEETYTVDGVNVWNAILSDTTSPREEIVYNIDNYNSTYSAAIRVGRYKLIAGNAGLPNTIVTAEEVTGQFAHGTGGESGNIVDEPGAPYFRLFDLNDDPYEELNLAYRFPSIVTDLNSRLDNYLNQTAKSIFQYDSPDGNPSLFGGRCGLDWCEPIITPEDANLKLIIISDQY